MLKLPSNSISVGLIKFPTASLQISLAKPDPFSARCLSIGINALALKGSGHSTIEKSCSRFNSEMVGVDWLWT